MRSALLPLIWFISAGLLLVPAPSRADVNLPMKRKACQAEARQRIRPPRSHADRLAYQAIVERRRDYIRQCMARPEPPRAPASKAPSAKPRNLRK
jgi:hypothetical protein